MGQKAVLCCEDSQEGIFTAVYDGWAGRYGHENVRLQVREEEDRELFSSYINVRTDAGKARKVSDTVRRRMGGRAYLDIARAALSWEADKGTAIYHTIVRGLSMADGFRVMQVLTDPYVCRVSALARAVAREADHLMGFARFSQLPGGVLYARIRPRDRVLPAIAPHFQDRLPGENWVIHDEGREEAAVHPAGGSWFLTDMEAGRGPDADRAGDAEREIEELWRGFCRSIALQERENPRLQAQMLPKRFRKYMTEF